MKMARVGHLKWEAAKTAITLRHLIKAALNVRNIPSPIPKLFLRSHLGSGSYADLYHMRETDIFGIDYTFHFDTEIETGGLFFGASTNDTLNEYSSWYFRGALQVNWTEFSDGYRWENENGESGGQPFSKDLTGVAFLLGAGVYVPITDAAGINFGLETKSYDYDNELDAIYEETTMLSENQTSLIVSLSLGF